MAGLFHDTIFGQLFRLLSPGNFMQYPDEKDPTILQRYVSTNTDGRPINLRSQKSHEVYPKSATANRESSPLKHILDQAASPNTSNDKKADGEEKNNDGSISLDPEEGYDKNIVDWYGDMDPENPKNWSSAKKALVTSITCLLNFAFYVGSAIYTAGEVDVMEKFKVSETVATLGLILFIIGYGLGPVLWSPMSEIPKFGGNPVYIWTTVTFVLLQIPTALSTNIGMLLVFRFTTGFVGSPALATGGATIGDMYKPSKIAYGICIWGAFGVCGPALGPLIGSFATQAKGWTWTIWELMWLFGFVLVLMLFFLPETSHANILHRRAKRLRKLTGNEPLKSRSEIRAAEESYKDTLIVLRRAFSLSFREPIVFVLNLYVALLYGLLYIWFESFPIVFQGIYNFTSNEEALAFLGIFVGGLLTVPVFLWYLHRYIVPRFNDGGVIKPEERLPPVFVGAFCLPICLFWFGWSSRESVHWIVPIVGSGIFTVGVITMFNSVLNYLGGAYPNYAASVFASNGLMRSSFGATFPLFARALFDRLGVAGGNSLLGGISILFIPVPFALYYYGARIRHASKRALHDY